MANFEELSQLVLERTDTDKHGKVTHGKDERIINAAENDYYNRSGILNNIKHGTKDLIKEADRKNKRAKVTELAKKTKEYKAQADDAKSKMNEDTSLIDKIKNCKEYIDNSFNAKVTEKRFDDARKKAKDLVEKHKKEALSDRASVLDKKVKWYRKLD